MKKIINKISVMEDKSFRSIFLISLVIIAAFLVISGVGIFTATSQTINYVIAFVPIFFAVSCIIFTIDMFIFIVKMIAESREF